jgi:hypothetical protein
MQIKLYMVKKNSIMILSWHKFLTLTSLCLGWTQVLALEGFDCDDNSHESTMSLLEAPNCVESQAADLLEIATSGRVVQHAVVKTIPARMCTKIRTTKKVYCNWMKVGEYKLDAGNVNGFIGDPYSDDECDKLFRTKSVLVGKLNYTVRSDLDFQYTDNRILNANGYCKSWAGEVAVNIYIVSYRKVNITVQSTPEGRAGLYRIDGEVINVGQEGNTGTTLTGKTVLWNVQDIPSCFLEVLYDGPVTEVTDSVNTTQIMIKDRGVGLSLHQEDVICNIALTKTNVPFMYYTGNYGVKLPPTTSDPTVILTVHTQALIQGLFTSTALSLSKTTSEIKTSMCLIEQQVNRDIVYGVDRDPDMTAYRLLGQRGWRLIRAGAVMHLMRCKPLTIQLNLSPECSLDISVLVLEDNTERYLDPVSFVLHKTTTGVSCDDMRVPYIKIRDFWYRIGSSSVRVSAPKPAPSVLQASAKEMLTDARGLYPEESVKRAVQELTLEAAARQGELMDRAALTNSAKFVYAKGSEPVNLMPIDEDVAQLHYRNVLAFVAPPLLLTLIGALGWLARRQILTRMITAGLPDLLQRLPWMGEPRPAVGPYGDGEETKESMLH